MISCSRITSELRDRSDHVQFLMLVTGVQLPMLQIPRGNKVWYLAIHTVQFTEVTSLYLVLNYQYYLSCLISGSRIPEPRVTSLGHSVLSDTIGNLGNKSVLTSGSKSACPEVFINNYQDSKVFSDIVSSTLMTRHIIYDRLYSGGKAPTFMFPDKSI